MALEEHLPEGDKTVLALKLVNVYLSSFSLIFPDKFYFEDHNIHVELIWIHDNPIKETPIFILNWMLKQNHHHEKKNCI